MRWRELVVVYVVVVGMLISVLNCVLKLFVEMRAQESLGRATAKWRAVLHCGTLV
jgi:hypothetical protein